MNYLPIFLDIKGKTAKVIGGGGIAARKADLLLKAGARVDLLLKAGARVEVIAPETHGEMTRKIEDGELEWVERGYQSGDLEDAVLVIAATDDATTNEQVAADAQALKIPCNVVDNPQLCSFIMPSIPSSAVLSCRRSSIVTRYRSRFPPAARPLCWPA